MKYYMLDKSKMNDFISALKGKYRVVGPKAKENQFAFGEIESADELKLLHKPTILSLKKYFLAFLVLQEVNLIQEQNIRRFEYVA